MGRVPMSKRLQPSNCFFWLPRPCARDMANCEGVTDMKTIPERDLFKRPRFASETARLVMVPGPSGLASYALPSRAGEQAHKGHRLLWLKRGTRVLWYEFVESQHPLLPFEAGC